jgi:hypothetical protein
VAEEIPLPETDLEREVALMPVVDALVEQTGGEIDLGGDEEPEDGPPEPPDRGDLWDGLGEEGRKALAFELTDILTMHDAAVRDRRDLEDEIDQHYHMAAEQIHAGRGADSETLVSGLLMSIVDQADARIVDNIMGVDPLTRVDPIVREDDEDEVEQKKRQAFATKSGRFMHSFAMNDMRMDRKIPIVTHRACKVGTAVVHPVEVEREVYSRYVDTKGNEQEQSKSHFGIDAIVVPNRDVIAWPVDNPLWQELKILGHRSYLSLAEFRRLADQLEVSEEDREHIETGQPYDDALPHERGRVESESTELKEKLGHIQVTDVWLEHEVEIKGKKKFVKMHVILNEDTRILMRAATNRRPNRRRPYFPIRYKILDDQAWGVGAGEEVLSCQTADTALWNLDLDNIAAGAYNVIQVRAGSSTDKLFDRVMPGQKVVVDTIGEDFQPTSMGGAALGLEVAKEDVVNRATRYSGLSPVLGGQGDPTLKSGGGTGSTVALIEQAGKKFGKVDRTMREDWSDLFQDVFETITLRAPDGVYYRYASPGDAAQVKMMKYLPYRGPVSEAYRVTVKAPDAATSREARKHSRLTLWQFVNQHIQLEMQVAQMVYADNPEMIRRHTEAGLQYMNEFARSIIEDHNIPTLASTLPKLPEPTPQDQKINELMQQLQQSEQQLQAMMAQMQGQPPPQPGEPAPQQQGVM